MRLDYQNNLANKEQQLHATIELHKDDPKIEEFITEALALNDQLLQQEEILCQRISQWNFHCEKSDNVTNQVIDLRIDYDLVFKKVSDFLNWQKSEEGKREELPRIDEAHKEMLFVKWDAQLKEAEQAMEEAATAASNVIDCINKNMHKANLISDTTPRFLPKAQQVQTRWKQMA